MVTRYRAVADELKLRMEEGLYPPGTRLPGVRKLASQFGVSVSTVIAAVQLLEDGGRLQARPRSGYFVKPRPQAAGNRLPVSRPPRRPNLVTSQALALELMRATHHPEIVQFGAAVPDTRFYPQAALRRAFSRAQQREAWESLSYAFPPGVPELRYEVARRLADSGLTVSPDRVVITGGAQEAIALALRTVTEPGDVVAVESPTFYGLLQVLDSLGPARAGDSHRRAHRYQPARPATGAGAVVRQGMRARAQLQQSHGLSDARAGQTRSVGAAGPGSMCR